MCVVFDNAGLCMCRIAKSLERLVTTLTVDVDQPFQKQEKNLGFAVSCPEENATTQAFRSISPLGDGTFYVGKANTSAAGETCKDVFRRSTLCIPNNHGIIVFGKSFQWMMHTVFGGLGYHKGLAQNSVDWGSKASSLNIWPANYSRYLYYTDHETIIRCFPPEYPVYSNTIIIITIIFSTYFQWIIIIIKYTRWVSPWLSRMPSARHNRLME